jgi:GT2 family glycosyltransferase
VPLDSNITIAILNWNGLGHLKQFLPSVVENSGKARIRVVDNASTDESVAWIKSEYPKIELHILPRNQGFTGGYNTAIAEIKTKYTVLLNSDVEVSDGWLDFLLERMESNHQIAACQPKILSFRQKTLFEYAGASGGYLDVLAYPFCRGRIFETCETDSGQYNDARQVFWASGACMMVKTAVFVENGGFENAFFAHMEEIDLCWRFWSRGYEVWVEPKSVVYHLGAGTLAKSNPKKTFLNYRNGIAMLCMNSSLRQICWKIPLRLVLDGLAGVRFVTMGEWANCMAIAKAHVSFYSKISWWLKRRRENEFKKTATPPSNVHIEKSIIHSYFLKGKKIFRELDSMQKD